MVLTEFGITSECKFIQPSNALSPIVSIVFESSKEERLLHPLKHPDPIDFTPDGIMSVGIRDW